MDYQQQQESNYSQQHKVYDNTETFFTYPDCDVQLSKYASEKSNNKSSNTKNMTSSKTITSTRTSSKKNTSALAGTVRHMSDKKSFSSSIWNKKPALVPAESKYYVYYCYEQQPPQARSIATSTDQQHAQYANNYYCNMIDDTNNYQGFYYQ